LFLYYSRRNRCGANCDYSRGDNVNTNDDVDDNDDDDYDDYNDTSKGNEDDDHCDDF